MGKFTGLLLASDFDGTLVGRSGHLLPRVKEAIDYFMGEGGQFALCTGRTRLGLEAIREEIPFNAPAILSNGALIYDYSREKTIHTQYLEGNYLEIVQMVANAFPEVAVEAHTADALWVFNPNEGTERHFELIGRQGTIMTSLQEAPTPWMKAVFVNYPDVLAKVRSMAAHKIKGRYMLVSSLDTYLEFLDHRANKGEGVQRLADLLGIEHDNVYVIGDNNNDMPMITRFNSFVPKNGTEEVRKAADLEVADVEDGAVADAIQWLDEHVCTEEI